MNDFRVVCNHNDGLTTRDAFLEKFNQLECIVSSPNVGSSSKMMSAFELSAVATLRRRF